MRPIDGDALLEIFADRLAKVAERYGFDSAVTGAVSGAMKLTAIQPTIEPEHHAWFLIGETLVEESKGHISADDAVRKIRELMKDVQKPERKTDGGIDSITKGGDKE